MSSYRERQLARRSFGPDAVKLHEQQYPHEIILMVYSTWIDHNMQSQEEAEFHNWMKSCESDSYLEFTGAEPVLICWFADRDKAIECKLRWSGIC